MNPATNPSTTTKAFEDHDKLDGLLRVLSNVTKGHPELDRALYDVLFLILKYGAS